MNMNFVPVQVISVSAGSKGEEDNIQTSQPIKKNT